MHLHPRTLSGKILCTGDRAEGRNSQLVKGWRITVNGVPNNQCCFYITVLPPRCRVHLRRLSRKTVRTAGPRGPQWSCLEDMTESAHSWTHSLCGHLHTICTRLEQVRVQQRGHQLPLLAAKLLVSELLGEEEAGLGKVVAPDRTAKLQWMEGSGRRRKQNKNTREEEWGGEWRVDLGGVRKRSSGEYNQNT